MKKIIYALLLSSGLYVVAANAQPTNDMDSYVDEEVIVITESAMDQKPLTKMENHGDQMKNEKGKRNDEKNMKKGKRPNMKDRKRPERPQGARPPQKDGRNPRAVERDEFRETRYDPKTKTTTTYQEDTLLVE